MMGVFCLSIHADYRCRHAGACCKADWHVPVEGSLVALVEARGIGPPDFRGARFTLRPGSTETALARDGNGICAFLDAEGGGLCSIHQQAGEAALPSACRHFPRTVLSDDRGTFIALSHFCPTAAAMLLERSAVNVVEARPPLRIDRMEGFEARGALPPLLRPDLLCDLEGYDAWERACIATLGRRALRLHAALDIISAATERIRQWQPGNGSLAAMVERSFADAHAASAGPARTSLAEEEDDARRVGMLRAMEGTRLVPAPWLPDVAAAGGQAQVPSALEPFERAVANYLAARLFANHTAYEGRGLRTILEWVRTCLAVLRHQAAKQCARDGAPLTPGGFVEAVRAADLLLVHAADTKAFARDVAAVEGAAAR